MAVTPRGSVIVAGDPEGDAGFGNSIALNATGTIMAVGCPYRDSGTTNGGGVYIFDWSGSAWVQRGSVLVPGSPQYNEYFGIGVALSDDGLVLAVGAQGYYAASPDRYGGVYIFDWSGSAWVQRGSVLQLSSGGDAFGSAVALSSDGAILAVGDAWDSTDLSSGGCAYIFDWSGSAWSQRGGRITPSAYYPNDSFGTSLALSGSGAILAVSSPWRDVGGAGFNDGQVFVFDWSGSAWSERGTLTPADAGANDWFGFSVSLSSDGAILGVGATGWDNAVSGMGVLYLYDWSGSAWVEREKVTAADAATDDHFGSGSAMSSSGDVLVVGAAEWEGTQSGQGGVYVFDVENGDYAVAYTSLTIDPSTGTAIAPTALTVTQIVSAPTSLTVSSPTGSAVAATALSVTATGSASAATALAVVDLSEHHPLWSARVLIDGVDVSTRVRGTISVDAEEDAARVAFFSMIPASGTVAPLNYVGKPVVIDYLQTIAGASVARRLFTGRIDTPRYTVSSGQLDFECVDDLQNIIAALDRSTIDTLVAGRYTAAVQGDILDNWDYARARMSTRCASLDCGPHANPRVSEWELTSTWATLDEDDLIYDTSTVSFPQRSTLVNRVEATFEYRYPRLRQRYASTGWSGTIIDMAPNGYQYPTQQDIIGAASGSGWTVTNAVLFNAPAAIPHSSGGFIYPPAGSIDMAILWVTQRHSQTVTETFALTVTAPESVTANGELAQSMRGALASEFDGQAWESALDVAPMMATGGDMDHAPDAPRADADYAIETLLDQARAKILGSHRGGRVGNATLCNPDLDLDKKLAISTALLDATGKVARVAHRLDLEAGSAITEFELATFAVGGVGIITPDSLDAPTPPAEAAETQDWASAVPALTCNTYGITPYSDALMGLILNPPETITVEDIPGVGSSAVANPYYTAGTYPVEGFRMQMPGVDDADRNPLDKTTAASYSILIPSDTITFTVP